jgi:predicted transcriptional regulator
MRTLVQETSAIAYHDLRQSGQLSNQQAHLLHYINPHRDYSLQELVLLTHLPINVVSGRVNELKTIGVLVHSHAKRKCSITNRMINPVRLPTKQIDWVN